MYVCHIYVQSLNDQSFPFARERSHSAREASGEGGRAGHGDLVVQDV